MGYSITASLLNGRTVSLENTYKNHHASLTEQNRIAFSLLYHEFYPFLSSISKIPIVKPARSTEFYPVLHNPNSHIHSFTITLFPLSNLLKYLFIRSAVGFFIHFFILNMQILKNLPCPLRSPCSLNAPSP